MTVASPPRPPAQDETEALIPEARERQRRRRLLALATVAVAVALGLSIYGAAAGSGPLGTIQRSLGLGTAPTCRSMQLNAHLIAVASATGGGIAFTNTGSTCSLPLGTPRAGFFWHGQRLSVQQIHATHPFAIVHGPVVHVLGPGKSAQIDIDWRNWCGPRPKLPISRDDQMTLSFRFGNAPIVSVRFLPNPECTQPGAPSTIAASRPFRYPS